MYAYPDYYNDSYLSEYQSFFDENIVDVLHVSRFSQEAYFNFNMFYVPEFEESDKIYYTIYRDGHNEYIHWRIIRDNSMIEYDSHNEDVFSAFFLILSIDMIEEITN